MSTHVQACLLFPAIHSFPSWEPRRTRACSQLLTFSSERGSRLPIPLIRYRQSCEIVVVRSLSLAAPDSNSVNPGKKMPLAGKEMPQVGKKMPAQAIREFSELS